MRILTDFGKAWRDYLYANSDSLCSDADDFILRVQLISDSHDQILETMLEDTPNMDLVKECKDEIAFQIDHLKEMIGEFVDTADLPDDCNLSMDEIISDLVFEGTKYYLYEIAAEWKQFGERAHKIFENLNDSYGYGIGYIGNDLCRLIYDEIYASPSYENTSLESEEA